MKQHWAVIQESLTFCSALDGHCEQAVLPHCEQAVLAWFSLGHNGERVQDSVGKVGLGSGGAVVTRRV